MKIRLNLVGLHDEIYAQSEVHEIPLPPGGDILLDQMPEYIDLPRADESERGFFRVELKVV